MKNLPLRTCLLALLPCLTSIGWAQEPTLDVLRIAYSDDAGRTIDYDFTSGTIDEAGWIAIPAGAVLNRPASERNASYEWGDTWISRDSRGIRGGPGFRVW